MAEVDERPQLLVVEVHKTPQVESEYLPRLVDQVPEGVQLIVSEDQQKPKAEIDNLPAAEVQQERLD